MIAFSVPGEPQGKGRARVGRVAGHARMFTPAKTVAYEGLIAHAAAAAMDGAPPLAGPVTLLVEARQIPPASWSAKKRAAALAGHIRPTTKPDWDNIGKAVGDAGNGVLWLDDRQIVDGRVVRFYADRAELRVFVAAADTTPRAATEISAVQEIAQ